ncbi:hypothetical protein HRR83_004701 [Exophiala dermatitidis]|uniref:Uncharacterized protein n=1 Tax=Exophiala dermatitidis TaxID=5970 RepID=A0AAN6EZN0_EXODE|nr:hypothetical protein HRR74_004017 [Exophiala dermatitidis]KAJ4529092.1 hypothetical protein HRR73_000112 [Exophiala dermatitidis]KAJ4538492.1 hypothetical protein HRR77_006975 [Exophiala dermatitidis]KAJ4544262.1 hypothetical protein HRR76_002328 [Exophiala dermatitidis]KAJ4561681.1 hypothetical protein HRR79_007018 [Exophiala dermatitidis]
MWCRASSGRIRGIRLFSQSCNCLCALTARSFWFQPNTSEQSSMASPIGFDAEVHFTKTDFPFVDHHALCVRSPSLSFSCPCHVLALFHKATPSQFLKPLVLTSSETHECKQAFSV